MGVQFMVPPNNYSGNKYNNDEKNWNIARITKMWPRNLKWANAVGKMASVDLVYAGLPQAFNFLGTLYLQSG